MALRAEKIKVTVRQRKTNIVYHLYVEPKSDTIELIYKTDLQIKKTKGKVWREGQIRLDWGGFFSVGCSIRN